MKIFKRSFQHSKYRFLVGVLLVALIGSLVFSFRGDSQAATRSFSADDLQSGSFDSAKVAVRNGNISLQPGSYGSWNDDGGVIRIPYSLQGTAGGMAVGPNNTLYGTYNSGGGPSILAKYSLDEKTWKQLADPPEHSTGEKSVLLYDGASSLYYFPGANTDRFYRYNIIADTWSLLATLPAPTASGSGSALHATYVATGSGKIVMHLGSTTSYLYQYDIGSNVWSQLAPLPRAPTTWGVGLTWDGGSSIYAVFNQNGGSHPFYRYDLTTAHWSDELAAPFTDAQLAGELFPETSDSLIAVFSGDRIARYTITSNTWQELNADPPATAGSTVAFDPLNKKIYAILGYPTLANIHTYDLSQAKWDQDYSLKGPSNYSWHSQLAYDGVKYAYYIDMYQARQSTNNSYSLLQLDMDTKKVVQIASMPSGEQPNNASLYMNGELYFSGRKGVNIFWKYTISTNTWTQLANLPQVSNYSITFVDGGNGYMYAQINNKVLYRYNTALNTWDVGATYPTGSLDPSVNTGSGITRIGASIYSLSGGGSVDFRKYNIATNTWDTLPALPTGFVREGGEIISDGTKYIYIAAPDQSFEGRTTSYRFNVQTDTWERLADLSYGFGFRDTYMFWDTARNRLYVAPTSSAALLYYWTPSTVNYQSAGIWYSKPLDLVGVERWTKILADVSGPGAVMYSRTSSNNVLWSAWQKIENDQISSPANRYLQVKAMLSGDGTTTPTVSNLRVVYDPDSTPPILPSQLEGLSGTKENIPLSSGGSYEYLHPQFSWKGANDGLGSGVDGYYVYYGEDSSADPRIAGTYQRGSSYKVSLPMNNNQVYYLRLAVKDKLGNTSNASTYFSYRYAYLSPPSTALVSDQASIQTATNYQLDTSDSSGILRLQHQVSGIWGLGAGIISPIAPAAMSTDTGLEFVGDQLYAVGPSSNRKDLWRYDRLTGEWTSLASLPTPYSGGTVVNGGDGFLYVATANNGVFFYRYNIAENIWDKLRDLPQAALSNSDMTAGGDGKIYMVFTSSKDFYAYDIKTDSYSMLLQMPGSGVGDNSWRGSGMWSDGQGKIYVQMGAYGFSVRGFAVYSIATNTWEELPSPPGTPVQKQKNLVSDGKDILYMLVGYTESQNTQMAMYHIKDKYWTTEKNNGPIAGATVLASDENRYLYWVSGGNIQAYDTDQKQLEPEVQWPGFKFMTPWGVDYGSNGNGNIIVTSGLNINTPWTTDSKNYYLTTNSGHDVGGIFKFNPQTKVTELLPAPPFPSGYGSSLVYSGGYLYYLRAGSTADFYRYDFAAKWWEKMTNVPTAISDYSFMVADKDGHIYLARGSKGAEFYRYTPNSGTGTWDTLTSSPAQLGSYGYSLTYDGSGAIYAIRSSRDTNSKLFYKYVISSNQWIVLSNPPANWDSQTTSLFYQDGKVYDYSSALRGIYVYDVSTNAWSSKVDASLPQGTGGGLFPIDSHRMGVGYYGGLITPYVFPSSNTAYNSEGTHISQPIQIPGLFDYAGIRMGVDIPENTDIEVYTRTSPDSSTWNDWVTAKDINSGNGQLTALVASPPQLFTQLKIVLKSHDNVYSPSVSSYALDYYADTTPPTNPSELHVYGTPQKTQEFATTPWHTVPNPYIEWPQTGQAGGASDGLVGSRIKGYYIYVGTDETANPKTAGVFTTDTHYQPVLPASGIYYIRMQAVDMTGNLDPMVFAPYIYRLDKDPPTAPALITATPSGLTANNDFSFTWPSASDSHSGIEAYCYRTAASSGPFSVEQCITDRSLSHVSAAYTQGTNILYIRTKDKAGNYSEQSTEVSYYYSTAPPTAPTMTQAIPPVSSQNLFSFTWGLPEHFSGSPDNIHYCWSLNVVPSETNAICTLETSVPAFKAATILGENTFYVVAKDEAGNVDWSSYATTTFRADTTAPGIPIGLKITDSSSQAQDTWSLTLTWEPPATSPPFEQYVVERSSDNQTFTEVGKVPQSTTAYVDLSVQSTKSYFYRVRAEDGVGNQGAASAVAQAQAKGVFAKPPTIVSKAQVQAGFNQVVVKWVTERPSTSFIFYGSDPQNLSNTQGGMNLSTEHSITITGLSSLSTYYFKVQSFDLEHSYPLDEAMSSTNSFRTAAATVVSDVAISDVGIDSAIAQFSTSTPMSSTITMKGEDGENQTPLTVSQDPASSHLFRFSNLRSGTTYHFIITAFGDGGSITSDEYSFTTISLPKISNIEFQPDDTAGEKGVLVNWQTNVPTDSKITYEGLNNKQETAASELVTTHSFRVGKLASDSKYQFVLEGRDTNGNKVVSEKQTWTSGLDTRPALISGIQVEVTALRGSDQSLAVISWETDEPTSSQVRWGEGSTGSLGQETGLDTDLKTTHKIVVSNLKGGTIYRFQPVVRDHEGNFSYGQETLGVTPRKVPDILTSLIQLATRFLIKR